MSTTAAFGLRDPPRARLPETSGFAERDGVRIAYEVFGAGRRTVMLLPTWSALHSRMWKLQIPYLARHFRVIAFDGRGNGRSDRPVGAKAYSTDAFAADAVAVLDATDTPSATLVGLSCGVLWAMVAAADHPERVDKVACICPATPLAPNHPARDVYPFDEPLATDEGWARYNSHYWRRDYPEFLRWFADQCLPERHSAKAIEDFVTWGLQTTPELLADATRGTALPGAVAWPARCAEVRCPVLVIHGSRDHIRPLAQGAALPALTGGQLVTLDGAGHVPHLRHPVRVNLLLREFIASPRLRPR